MGTNELGEKTVKVVAKRNRLFYLQRMVSIGDEFECDERQAKNWERTGAVDIISERPRLKQAATPPVDPAVAAVVKAESTPVKPPHEARAESVAPATEAAVAVTTPEVKPEVDSEVKAEAEPVVEAAQPEPEAKVEPPKPQLPSFKQRYDRRDLRAKS